MSIEVFPVVHVQNVYQAKEQTAVALEAAADGVYLIDHFNFDPDPLLETFNKVSNKFPDAFIGLNFLQLESGYRTFEYLRSAYDQGAIDRYPDAVWVDDASFDREKLLQLKESDPALKNIRYLGGVAFKYTRLYTEDPAAAAVQAVIMSEYVDVVTTSGKGTNVAPNPLKIAAMKQAIGDKPLAVSSGISTKNIGNYGNDIDQILVASSVETKPYSGEFDVARLKQFIAAAHSIR